MVDRLDSLDPDANGLLSEDKGGFPNFWQGTEWALVSSLYAVCQQDRRVPIRSLAERLLISRAAVPATAGWCHFTMLRVDRLLAIAVFGLHWIC